MNASPVLGVTHHPVDERVLPDDPAGLARRPLQETHQAMAGHHSGGPETTTPGQTSTQFSVGTGNPPTCRPLRDVPSLHVGVVGEELPAAVGSTR